MSVVSWWTIHKWEIVFFHFLHFTTKKKKKKSAIARLCRKTTPPMTDTSARTQLSLYQNQLMAVLYKNINSLFITALPALMVTEVRPSLLCRVKAGLRHQLASCMSWTVGGNRSTSERSHTDAVRTCKLHKEMPWIRTKLATYLLWAAAVKPIMPKSYL